MLQKSHSNNIKISYVLSFLAELYFPITAWLFFYLRYLDFREIAIITSVHVLTSNLLEVPTGAFADLIGRKKAIFLAFFICSLVMFAYPFNSVFSAFMVLEILGGLTNSLLSGSLEALTYDSLKEDGRESTYDKVVANMQTLSWIGLFTSAVIGGFTYEYWFGSPWILQGVVFGVAALLSLGFHEPRIDTKKYDLGMIFSQNIIGFKEIFKNARSAQISTVFIIIGSGYFIAGKILGLSQAREYGLDARTTGLLFAAGYLLTALASQFFPKLKNWLGAKKLLILVTSLLIGSFLLAKYVSLILGTLLIVTRISSSTTFNNLRSSLLNRFVDSKNRATAISSLMLLTQLPYVFLSYVIGDFIDQSSPNSFASILGMAMVLALISQQIAFSLAKSKSQAR
ncbi:MAG: MFS transporter [Patescibacteria group bacterium]